LNVLKYGWLVALPLALVGFNIWAYASHTRLPAARVPPVVVEPEPSAPQEKPNPPPLQQKKDHEAKGKKAPPPNDERFNALLVQGKKLLAQKKAHEAKGKIDEALAIRPEDPEAQGVLQTIKQLLQEFTDLYQKSQKSLEDNQSEAALRFLRQALELVVDDRAANEMLERIRLPGSALVLVLHTRALLPDNPKFIEQIEDLNRKQGGKMLGRQIQVLTWTKGIQPLVGTPLETKEAFEDKHVAELLGAACRAIAGLEKQAQTKDFRVILIWATDYDPTADDLADVSLPKGRAVYLCYYFTDRNQGGEALIHRFGKKQIHRLFKLDGLKDFVEFFLEK
jgi:hypothetical protein